MYKENIPENLLKRKRDSHFKENIKNEITGEHLQIDIKSEYSFCDIEPYLKSVEHYREYFKHKNPKFSKDFTFDVIISKGSYGVILKGQSRKYKKQFAFKMIYNKNILNLKCEKSLLLIKNEISILQKLKNKHINQFYGFYEIADSFCYVLEYEKYGDLCNFLKLLKRSQLSETMLGYISLQLLNALDHCHRLGIAHLDIKKQNILVDGKLTFKLCDFSVSTEYIDNNVKLNSIGSSVFISPENLQHEIIKSKDLNKVDLYSFGVLIYNLAFGIYPYSLNADDSHNYSKILHKIQEEDLMIPNNISHSDKFRNFLEQILHRDIKDRISIKDALRHPWIVAAETIFEEKEKISDPGVFLVRLMTDNVNIFNKLRFI
jgi:serine/threonine protein kinase